MTEEEGDLKEVWVFNGPNNQFPSAVFTSRGLAEAWIGRHNLRGTLTAYPLNVSAYDWAVGSGYFEPRGEGQTRPEFIANFSSAHQRHYHYGGDED